MKIFIIIPSVKRLSSFRSCSSPSLGKIASVSWLLRERKSREKKCSQIKKSKYFQEILDSVLILALNAILDRSEPIIFFLLRFFFSFVKYTKHTETWYSRELADNSAF